MQLKHNAHLVMEQELYLWHSLNTSKLSKNVCGMQRTPFDEEANRAMREGLDEETLALFDLLKKPDLSSKETQQIKKIASGLLASLKNEKLKIDHWQDKEATRDAVSMTIHDFLYDESTGLPVNLYSPDDVIAKAEEVYRHVYRAYPRLPSPYYEQRVVV